MAPTMVQRNLCYTEVNAPSRNMRETTLNLNWNNVNQSRMCGEGVGNGLKY